MRVNLPIGIESIKAKRVKALNHLIQIADELIHCPVKAQAIALQNRYGVKIGGMLNNFFVIAKKVIAERTITRDIEPCFSEHGIRVNFARKVAPQRELN